MKSKKRICVIGGGQSGQNHIRALNEMGYLGGIVDSNPYQLAKLLSLYNYVNGYLCLGDSLKDQYDGYIVATPAETHYSIGSQLLSEGKNVLIEKPFTLCCEDAEKMIDISNQLKCKLMVGHSLLFHPAIIKIKEIIDSGRIGKLMYISSTRLNFGNVRTIENVVYSFASNDIAALYYLIGTLPISISAEGDCLLKKNVYDVVMTHFIYPDDIKAHVFISWLHPFKEQRIIVVGNKGMIYFDNSLIENNIFLFNKSIDWKDGLLNIKEEPTETIEYDSSSPLSNELEYFINGLDSEITINDGKSGYNVVSIVEEVTKQLYS